MWIFSCLDNSLFILASWWKCFDKDDGYQSVEILAVDASSTKLFWRHVCQSHWPCWKLSSEKVSIYDNVSFCSKNSKVFGAEFVSVHLPRQPFPHNSSINNSRREKTCFGYPKISRNNEVPLKPLGTIVLWCSRSFRGPCSGPMLLRNNSLSDSCITDITADVVFEKLTRSLCRNRGMIPTVQQLSVAYESRYRAFRLVVRSSFVFESSNCDWLK